MTPLEKLRRIKKQIDGRVSLTDVDVAWQVRRWKPLVGHETEVLSEAPSPEEAIEAVYKKLFPPIKKECGEGEERWFWNQETEYWEASNAARAHRYCDLANEQEGDNITYIFASRRSLGGGPHLVRAPILRGFLKLIEINPELKPPTEEQHE